MPVKIENMKLNKELSLKNDIVFKAFFSASENKKYLKDFLNSILNIEINELEVQEEVNLQQNNPREKGGRLDLQARLNDGLIVNIEMQMKNLNNLEQRNDIYEAKTISRYFERGKDYKEAKQLISIYILDYNLFGFEEYIQKTVKVLENHRDYQVKSIYNEYYIQLPRFRNTEVDMDIKLNQWLAIIDNTDRGRIKLAEEKNNIMREARQDYKKLTKEEELQIYLQIREEMWESDRTSEINFEKEKARENGLKEGIEEGRIEGEKSKQEEIAKNMLKEKIDLKLIVKITGLKEEEIRKLENIKK